MTVTYFDAPGEVAPVERLTTRKASDLARLLDGGHIPFAKLIECRVSDDGDIVVFEVEVEVGQLRRHPISPCERIAAVFHPGDERMPKALALRRAFPKVPHLNLRVDDDGPESLCLYDQPYHDVKPQWTGPRFVERIRSWLALTAKGKLHADDQPLEPLLWGYVGHIVLPFDLLGVDNNVTDQLSVAAVSLDPGDCFLVAKHRQGIKLSEVKPQYVVCALSTAPQPHGLIRYRPRNLQELARFTADAGLDLLGSLRQGVESAKEGVDKRSQREFLEAFPILLLRLPKSRTAGTAIESTDVWAFLMNKTIRQLGIAIGLWTEIDGQLGREPIPLPDRDGQSVLLDLLNPMFCLSRRTAAVLNGLDGNSIDTPIVCVGVGALGSQLVLNLARAGFGRWTLVDNDRLFPHNLARHALPGYAIGVPKAIGVSELANGLSDGEPAFTAIAADVLKPEKHCDEIGQAMKTCSVILDLSASVSVARHLSNEVKSDARRVSLFLNPSGDDLVLLSEDRLRRFPLDCLEMQYYRALVNDESLIGHFTPVDVRPRYGQSCRDVTSRIPQDAMALHAAIGSRAFRRATAEDGAMISIWRADPALAVRQVTIEPARVTGFSVGEWRVRTDSNLLDTLHAIRRSKLPNETGGVLLGSIDLERKTVYVVDTLPSPPDSDEWPTLYIRGSRGLKIQVERVGKVTDGALHYLGEWHSHPNGCSTAPSNDDLKVFSWLTEIMDAEGLPALMMIAGGRRRTSCFLGKMERIENLIPCRRS